MFGKRARCCCSGGGGGTTCCMELGNFSGCGTSFTTATVSISGWNVDVVACTDVDDAVNGTHIFYPSGSGYPDCFTGTSQNQLTSTVLVKRIATTEVWQCLNASDFTGLTNNITIFVDVTVSFGVVTYQVRVSTGTIRQYTGLSTPYSVTSTAFESISYVKTLDLTSVGTCADRRTQFSSTQTLTYDSRTVSGSDPGATMSDFTAPTVQITLSGLAACVP